MLGICVRLYCNIYKSLQLFKQSAFACETCMNRPSKPKEKIHPSNTYVEINQPLSQGNKPLAFFGFVSVHKTKKQNKTKRKKQTNKLGNIRQ